MLLVCVPGSYDLQKRNDDDDDLSTWLVLETVITDTLRIFDSAKDRMCVVCLSSTIVSIMCRRRMREGV